MPRYEKRQRIRGVFATIRYTAVTSLLLYFFTSHPLLISYLFHDTRAFCFSAPWIWNSLPFRFDTKHECDQSRLIHTQAWKQTSGDPSGQTWNYRGITLLYNFTTALLYMVSLPALNVISRLTFYRASAY